MFNLSIDIVRLSRFIGFLLELAKFHRLLQHINRILGFEHELTVVNVTACYGECALCQRHHRNILYHYVLSRRSAWVSKELQHRELMLHVYDGVHVAVCRKRTIVTRCV